MSVTIHHGDNRDVLRSLPDNSIDSVVTDPPYALVSIQKRFGKPGSAPAKGDVYQRAASGFMSQTWDTGEVAFAAEFWAEILRVLKPGGHVVAFSGTRTYHRMAVAIEDAGFEIRDQLGWLYGSGFPKSHDVAKGIDAKLGYERAKVRKAAPKNPPNLVGGVNRGGGRPWVERALDRGFHEVASPEAAAWQGYGTALKPAWEPICLARKPLADASIDVVMCVEAALRERGVEGVIRWVIAPASGVDKSSRTKNSSSTAAPKAAEISAGIVDGDAIARGDPRIQMGSEMLGTDGLPPTQAGSESCLDGPTRSYGTRFSQPTEITAPAAEKPSDVSSPLIISPEGEPPIGDRSTERFTPSSGEKAFQADTECFAGIATGLSGSMAHVLIRKDEYGQFLWPENLPKWVDGRPLTVAENVLRWGVGALNIDGCRIEGGGGGTVCGNRDADGRCLGHPDRSGSALGVTFHGPDGREGLGRWPANIVHDGSPEVVAGFPDEAGAFAPVRGTEPSNAVNNVLGARERVATAHHGDAGSAARFFYSAKADREDRLGSKHPTVKPVDLMAWLVRLVTPPGGLVLDPFAGTGTTGSAAMREGMRCILIEREAEYVEDIHRRIAWVKGEGRLTAQETARKQESVEALPLFGGAA